MKEKICIGFLYITHDLTTAHYIAEETAVMYRSRIVEWGDTRSILRNPQHPYTKLLISAVPDPDLPFNKLVDSSLTIHKMPIRSAPSVLNRSQDIAKWLTITLLLTGTKLK